MVCMCVLVNYYFIENHSTWSYITHVILRWGCYSGAGAYALELIVVEDQFARLESGCEGE
jgi:hypothetical protein